MPCIKKILVKNYNLEMRKYIRILFLDEIVRCWWSWIL